MSVHDHADQFLPTPVPSRRPKYVEPIEDEVRNIRTPTLIIAGEDDPLFNREYVTKKVLPTAQAARAVFLPCGHEIPFELPNETAALLEAFFAGLQS